MAIVAQCKECEFYRKGTGLCTKYWQIPVYDDVECLKTQNDLNSIEEHRIDETVATRNEDNSVSLYDYHRDYTESSEDVVYTSSFRNILMVIFVLLLISLFCGFVGFLLDEELMKILGLISAFVLGLFGLIHFFPMNRHKDDYVVFSPVGIRWKYGKNESMLMWRDILECEFVPQASTNLYEGRMYLRIHTRYGEEVIVEMTTVSCNIKDVVLLTNKFSSRELLNMSEVSAQRWKSVVKVFIPLLLYFLYRLYRQGVFGKFI